MYVYIYLTEINIYDFCTEANLHFLLPVYVFIALCMSFESRQTLLQLMIDNKLKYESFSFCTTYTNKLFNNQFAIKT